MRRCACGVSALFAAALLTAWAATVILAAGPAFGSAAGSVDSLLGIPYRTDGVRDQAGRWTLFEHPERSFPTPGLNCSGLVYASWSMLVPTAVPVALAGRDRLGDSGPGAAMGQDWDYGFDLILNLSEGLPRRWLLPQPRAVRDSGAVLDSGLNPRGFPLTSREDWRAALANLPPGHACLVSFIRTVQPGRTGPIKGGGQIGPNGRHTGDTPLHYHVGVILPDAVGGRWLYQATPRSGVFKMNLAAPEGMDRFLTMFGVRDRQVLLLDVTLPPDRSKGAPPP